MLTKVRASRIDQLGTAIDLDLTLSPLGLQPDFLTPRFGISPELAATLAERAFQVEAGR